MPDRYGAEYPLGVDGRVEQVGAQVDLVGDVGVVELLEPAEADEPGHHELGGDHEVAADVLACVQRVLDLGEPLLVVVEVLLVRDAQARGLLERGHQRLADVEGPVRRCGACRPRRRSRYCVVVLAAGGDERRAEDDGGSGPGRPGRGSAPAQVGHGAAARARRRRMKVSMPSRGSRAWFPAMVGGAPRWIAAVVRPAEAVSPRRTSLRGLRR